MDERSESGEGAAGGGVLRAGGFPGVALARFSRAAPPLELSRLAKGRPIGAGRSAIDRGGRGGSNRPSFVAIGARGAEIRPIFRAGGEQGGTLAGALGKLGRIGAGRGRRRRGRARALNPSKNRRDRSARGRDTADFPFWGFKRGYAPHNKACRTIWGPLQRRPGRGGVLWWFPSCGSGNGSSNCKGPSTDFTQEN